MILPFLPLHIRPYGDYTEERMMMCGGFSPLLVNGKTYPIKAITITCRGDYTGEMLFFNSRSPLSEPDCFVSGFGLFIRVGEIHRERCNFILSFSPLFNLIWVCFLCCARFHVGENTQERRCINSILSFSPL